MQETSISKQSLAAFLPRVFTNHSIILTSAANHRGVDERHHFHNILRNNFVEQSLVVILQCGQIDVPIEIGGFASNDLHAALYLIIRRDHHWRQQTVDSKHEALRNTEGGTLRSNKSYWKKRYHRHSTISIVKLKIFPRKAYKRRTDGQDAEKDHTYT